MRPRRQLIARVVSLAFALAVFILFAIIANVIAIGLWGWLSVIPAAFAYRQAYSRLTRFR